MTRRDALAIISGIAGALTQQTLTTDSAVVSIRNWVGPISLTFVLDQWAKITVTYKGESVEIDPAELFAALKEKP